MDTYTYTYTVSCSHLLTPYFSLQVAYTASDAVFGVDKEKYPRFYRLVPVLEQTIDGCIALLKHLNWKRAAVIVYDDDYNVNVCFTYSWPLSITPAILHQVAVDPCRPAGNNVVHNTSSPCIIHIRATAW